MSPPSGRHERRAGISERVYRTLLRLYPSRFRAEYGDEMVRCFRDQCRDEIEDGGRSGLATLWVRVLLELFCTALKERSDMLTGNTSRSIIGAALAVAFLLAWTDLAVTSIEEPNALSWMTPIGFFAVPLIGFFVAYRGTKTRGIAYRMAVCVALAAAFFLAFANLAVGVIGSEDNPANLMYIGVLAIGVIGAIAVRFRAEGMVRAMFVTALAQALVPVVALIIWKPQVASTEGFLGILGVFGANGFFVALFVGAALLFRHAARERVSAEDGQDA